MGDLRIEERPDGTWRLRSGDATDHATRLADAVVDGNGRTWVHVEGDVVVVEPPDAQRRRNSRGAAPLESPMPAQVTAVLVSPGERVEPGTVLVLLEAMKMELPLRASSAGVVRAVHCAPGDRVAPGRTLVDLDPIDAS